ncbi:MAG: S-methyl-5-thioribose-1-phosphate isomerase [Anaerolineales bacterium]|nr:S-methyl-5-thioribose-1-phosphate isomerase [Anaerolineales bacterium]
MTAPNILQVESVAYDEAAGELILLDQTLLPNETRLLRLNSVEPIWEAIYALRVRGAPAIGIAAAYGLCAVLHAHSDQDVAGFRAAFGAVKERLASSRPTAVNLFWALDRMQGRLDGLVEAPVPALKRALLAEAHAIKAADMRMNRAIGEHALALLKPGDGLLTHCNAGQLATSKYGTATAPMYLGQERGYNFKVFADETRPLLQGARLTVFELSQAGIDVTLICDNMASMVMKNGWVQAVLVGCDRVAANGDAANKIGTSGVAILAKHYGIPFYVCAPTSTIDLACPDGAAIPIELRQPEEIRSMWYARPMAPEGVAAYNPAFDVTDHALITAIVTENGVARAPYTESLPPLVQP